MDDVLAQLASTPSSVRSARTLVKGALAEWGLSHLEDTAALLVSELVTNAVLHARSTFAVRLERRPGVVRIGVSDTSPRAPQRKRHSVTAGSGRGIGLVELLSSDWGADLTADGQWRKTVWCELPVDPAALPAPAADALLATA